MPAVQVAAADRLHAGKGLVVTEITEGIWNKATSFFDFSEFGVLAVYRLCPECSRFVKSGKASVNLLGDVRLEGWTCSRCGEVEPSYEWQGE